MVSLGNTVIGGEAGGGDPDGELLLGSLLWIAAAMAAETDDGDDVFTFDLGRSL
jgi:hypothetical protein